MATVYFERDTASGEYALLDRQTREVRPLYRQRKALDALGIAEAGAGDDSRRATDFVSTAI